MHDKKRKPAHRRGAGLRFSLSYTALLHRLHIRPVRSKPLLCQPVNARKTTG